MTSRSPIVLGSDGIPQQVQATDTLGTGNFDAVNSYGALSVYAYSTTPSTFLTNKAGGAQGSETTPVSGQVLSRWRTQMWVTGSNYLNAGSIVVTATATTPSATALDTSMVFNLGIGSSGNVAVLTLDPTNAGQVLSKASSVIIDTNSLISHRSRTLAQITAFTGSVAGARAWAIDLGGGAGTVEYNGTTWRRLSSGYATVATDADFTLAVRTNADVIRHTGTLTAARTITLSTTGAAAGDKFTITRTGSGSFNLVVGSSLKSLVTNTWCVVIFDGTAWYLAQYGAL